MLDLEVESKDTVDSNYKVVIQGHEENEVTKTVGLDINFEEVKKVKEMKYRKIFQPRISL